jgi:hypothetical protein
VSHVLFLTVVLGGALAVDFDRRDSHVCLGSVLALGAAGGVFLCIPDTDQSLVVLGAILPVALTGWPLRLAHLGKIGTPVWIGLYAWTVATGGIGRLAPTLAATGCLGLLVLEPLAHSLFSRSAPAESEDAPQEVWARSTGLLLSTQLLFVLMVARLGGVRSSVARTVLVLAVAIIVVEVLLLKRLGRRREAAMPTADSDSEGVAE